MISALCDRAASPPPPLADALAGDRMGDGFGCDDEALLPAPLVPALSAIGDRVCASRCANSHGAGVR